MPRDVARATLYRAPINLWVEDELTRAYLSELWNDPGIAYFIGGGKDGVRAVVHDAQEASYANVFGLVDRDLLRTNEAAWADPRKTFRTFVLPVHETENYLLDASALSDCRFNNVQRTRDDIEALMKAEAARSRSWAACSEVVDLLRARFRGQFLVEPTAPPVLTEAEAQAHICDSAWFRRLPRRVAAMTYPRIHRLLTRAHVRCDRRIADGTWRIHFAGKQILRDIGSRIFDATRMPKYRPTQAEFDADLAKEIGAWQVSHGAIPPSLIGLRTALMCRIGP